MRAHYLQHAPFETPGAIEGWLRGQGYGITSTHLYVDDLLPQLNEIDLLIIMGGPMSVNDEAGYPWLVEEKAFIRSVIDAGIPVLGICLGAQLIADAMGGRVYANSQQEIGWYPVRALERERADVFALPDTTTVLHWHGETFELPAGAVRLASSDICQNQAFQLGDRVIGLQFHLEADRQVLDGFVSACADDLQPADHVQSAEQILAVSDEVLKNNHSILGDLMTYLQHSGAPR